jgi:hypothetical protein
MHFVAVIGPSGCGKSSLIRAGVLAALRDGYIADQGEWTILTLNPGDSPLGAWVEALRPRLKGGSPPDRLVDDPVEALDTSSGPIAILVDQFEELFQSGMRSGADNDVARFINAVLAVGVATANIFVILTMRSENLPDCSRYPALADAINASLYLVPRLTREQMIQAIVGPIQQVGGTITVPLLERLILEAETDPDALPVLQHAMMRMWTKRRLWEPLGLDAYEGGTVLGAFLDEHADSIYASLPTLPSDDRPDSIAAETLFRQITEKASDGRILRHPLRLTAIGGSTGISEVRLWNTARVFQSEGFLKPSPGSSSFLADISHEALARKWVRLGAWINDEATIRGQVQRLLTISEEWNRNRRSNRDLLYRGKVLDAAEQFGPRLENQSVARDFLRESRKAANPREIVLFSTILLVALLTEVVIGLYLQNLPRQQSEGRFQPDLQANSRYQGEYIRYLESQLGMNQTSETQLGGLKYVPVPKSADQRNNGRIKHMVVLMLAGRSFDQMLGFLKGQNYLIDGLTGRESNPDADGTMIHVSRDAPYLLELIPAHTFRAVTYQIFGNYSGTMSGTLMQGFVKSYRIAGASQPNASFVPASVMKGFDPASVPVLTTLAKQYAVCDRWFSSVPGPILPNLLFIHAGTSMGRVYNDFVASYDHKTLFELLREHHVSSRIFFHDDVSVAHFKGMKTHQDYLGHFEDFVTACKSNTLPAYSFIEPRYENNQATAQPNSEQAGVDLRPGEETHSHGLRIDSVE